jgi:hypothetical protein
VSLGGKDDGSSYANRSRFLRKSAYSLVFLLLQNITIIFKSSEQKC